MIRVGDHVPVSIGSEYSEPHPSERAGRDALIPGFTRDCLPDGRALRQSRCGAVAIGRTEAGEERRIAYRCKDRLCSACSRDYQRRVYATIHARIGARVANWRMLTLTKPDSRSLLQTRESIDELRLGWRRLRALRAKRGAPPLDGIVCTELTTGGEGGPPHPHVHLHVMLERDAADDVARLWRETVSRISGREVEDLSAAAHYPRRSEYQDGARAADYLAGYCAVPVEVQHVLDVPTQRALGEQVAGTRRYDGMGALRGLGLRAETDDRDPVVAVRGAGGVWVDAARWYSGGASWEFYLKREEPCPGSTSTECHNRATQELDFPRQLKMRRA